MYRYNEMKNQYRWTIKMALWTPVLILISILLMGGGHGYYEPMIFLFPFSAILFIWFEEINLIFLFVSLVQYPVYGLLIDRFGKRISYTWLLILSIHLIIGILAYSITPEQFR